MSSDSSKQSKYVLHPTLLKLGIRKTKEVVKKRHPRKYVSGLCRDNNLYRI